MPLIEELSKDSSSSTFPEVQGEDRTARQAVLGEERSVCTSTLTTQIWLIHLIGWKLPLEEGRELQSIGLNPSLRCHIFMQLHQLHTAINPT